MATIEIPERTYAVGVQMFDRIRENKVPYVDKTAWVYRMVKTNAVNFRRNGKLLLTLK